MILKGIAMALLFEMGQTTATLPPVRFGLWQKTGYSHVHVPRSKGGHSGTSSDGQTFCVTAANYKTVFNLEGAPFGRGAGCVRSHEHWKGNKYTASIDCKANNGYEHIDVWVTIQDQEHVSMGEATGSLTDNDSSFGQDQATFVSPDCGNLSGVTR
ncbi:MAG TPA: hypothetical protein VMD97_00960 [Candidatus Aquilonibacter sp.]|nr:hypothetical protein [Candidatus Aquilonibacter sp.]